jgi:hypothetical protein
VKTTIAIYLCFGAFTSCASPSITSDPDYQRTVGWITQETRIFERHFPGKEYEYAISDGLAAARAYQNIDVTALDVVAWIQTHHPKEGAHRR